MPRNDEKNDRIKRLELLKSKGIIAFADKFEKIYNLEEIRQLDLGKKVKTAGRIVLFREMGKITFGHLQDFWGRMQVVFKEDVLSKNNYDLFIKTIDIGDFIGIEGEIFKTKKGELSILVNKYTFLSKALMPLPEKWAGLKNIEIKYRKRYLDLITNEETRKRFLFRSKFISELRRFYENEGFIEVETPVLCNVPSGALAKPFKTHHNALDKDVFLRIAPEIYLKQAIVGGFEKIFEVARSFRNEGMDPTHLQDFTMVEHYCAYWDYKMNMEFTEKMLTLIINKLKGTLKLKILNHAGNLVDVDFSTPWNVVAFRDLILNDSGIDIDKFPRVDNLRKAIMDKHITIDGDEKLGRGNLIDALYKIISREKIIRPTFLVGHPVDVSPLARRNENNPLITDRFQLVINGWEVVNAYSELIDPIDQKERFENQMKAKESGDEEAMQKDTEFIEAIEHGMPPVSGWGMGVDRIIALLTQQPNLKDVILFPLLKPE
jgi:lysyl-tRNA synthetase class 2